MPQPIFELGRVCIKIAGREAGRHCAVVEAIDENFVVVSGPAVRRRKCNVAHLEPLPDKIDASGDINQQLIEKYNIVVRKRKEKKEKPVKKRVARKEEKKEETNKKIRKEKRGN